MGDRTKRHHHLRVGNQSGRRRPALGRRPGVPGPNTIEPAAVFTKNALNTVDDVVAFGVGPGTEALNGTIENTAIFKIIRDEL